MIDCLDELMIDWLDGLMIDWFDDLMIHWLDVLMIHWLYGLMIDWLDDDKSRAASPTIQSGRAKQKKKTKKKLAWKRFI